MGVASLVLGIVSIVFAIIPILGTIAFIPALIGLILGIVFCVKKSKVGEPKKKGIAGIVLCGISIMFIFMYAGVETESEHKNTLTSNEQNTENNVQAQETKKYNVSEIFESENIAVKYVSKNENFTNYSKYADVKSGYKIIQLSFEFENVGTSDQFVSDSDFYCYADGYNCEKFWSVEDSGFYATLSAGKKTKGNVYFEVPQDAKEIIVEFEADSWTSTKAIFVVK